MICYTRNFEDVILQRVFSDLAQGHYLDVGASMPTNDSNTFALYQKSWRGVAIEPLPYQHLWQQDRPEDILLNAAIGEQTGTLTLHIFDEIEQISSGSREVLQHWQAGGWLPSRSIEVPVLTLNQVIAEYLPNRPLHLLSIDVEGMEHQVLKGLDITIHRPWVIVLEATFPGCTIPNHQDWEPYLLSADYLMAYFDGVNRFYLAREQSDLLKHFKLPPNVWDGFVMAKQIELDAEVARLNNQIIELNKQIIDLKVKSQISNLIKPNP